MFPAYIREILSEDADFSTCIRNAVASQQDLKATLNALLKDASRNITDSDELVQKLTKMLANVDGLDHMLGEVAHPSYYNEFCPADSDHLAQKVFNIPELLELILIKLDVRDLLVVQQVNRPFFNAVETSIKIQRKLCLQKDPKSHHQTPFQCPSANSFPGFSCNSTARNVAGRQTKADGTSDEEVTAMFAQKVKIGSRIKQMLICQPPVQDMEVFALCCRHMPYMPDRREYPMPSGAITSISKAGGLTVGDLHRVAMKIMEEHRLCPNATLHAHHDSGEVNVCVYFQGRVTLNADDPVLKEREMDAAKKAQRVQEDKERSEWLQPYIQAKQDGNRPLPTL